MMVSIGNQAVEELRRTLETGQLSPERRMLLAKLLKEKTRRTQDPSGEGSSLPELKPAPGKRYEPFPLTDLQHSYWLGRNPAFEFSALTSCTYLELECERLHFMRFQQAVRHLIQRHEMLRAVVLSDGTQQILREVPEYQIRVHEMQELPRDEQAQRLERIYQDMVEEVRPADQWPLFLIQVSILDEHRTHLHFLFDLLNFDASSVAQLFEELVWLYENPTVVLPEIEISFRDYLLTKNKRKQGFLYQRAREYWMKRIPEIPPAPELPLAKSPASILQPRFHRNRGTVETAIWTQLKQWASEAGITPAGILLTLFADVLAVWSKYSRFTINLPIFNRLDFHPQVDQIIGDFDTINLLSIDASQRIPFRERALRIQQQIWDDLEHRHMDGVEVLREIVRTQDGSGSARMPVVFTSLIDHHFDEKISRMGSIVRGVNQTSQVWLDLQVDEQNGDLVVKWDAIDELFPPGMMEDMFKAYLRLIRAMGTSLERWEQVERDLLPESQKEIQRQANATDTIQTNAYLHTLFIDQAIRTPDSIAVVAPDKTLTYEELRQRAHRIGHRLRREGIQPNDLVAIFMKKGWEQVAAALGIHISGGAYLPIDAPTPKERLFHILEHAGVKWVLTQSEFSGNTEFPETVHCLNVDQDKVWEKESTECLEVVQKFEDLAYVIYTSGSTGKPKGVMIDHRGAVNTILDVNQRFQVSENDRVLALSALSFDLSVYDIFGLLAAGGTIVIPEPTASREPVRWAELLERHQITLWNSVPALMQLLIEYHENHATRLPDSLRLVMMSGDWIPPALPGHIRRYAREDVQLISMGGATEASIWSILYPVGRVEADWKSIPYGKAMSNQHFHVLDDWLEPCPTWVDGELYIGGIGVAKGYYRDEEKTRASFIIHPRTGEYLYKTGDLGRYLPDGNIEFLGRVDFQVKVRGFRIEPGEIESTLLQHPDVSEAVVTAVGSNNHDRRLIGYVVPEQTARVHGRPAGKPAANVPVQNPLERAEFRLKNPSLRSIPDKPRVPLDEEPAIRDQELFLVRQSYRRFSRKPVQKKQISRLLSCLACLRMHDTLLPKYRYPSADGLYPVQVYLYIKPDRVEELQGGTYYYHPHDHTLIQIASGELLDRMIHLPANFDIFDESAFSIFQVAQFSAIQPLYGDESLNMCKLEAGYMGQLLMLEAPQSGIGLCPIIGVDFERVRHLFDLASDHVYIHSLIGGGISEHQQKQFSSLVECRSSELLAAAQEQNFTGQLVEPLSTESLRRFLADKLPDYMIPTSFVFLERLPLSANGKINRTALPAPQNAEQKASQSKADENSPLYQKIFQIASRVLQVPIPREESNLLHLGANSVDMIRIGNELEKEFGIRPRIDEIFKFQTIEALARYYEEKMPSRRSPENAESASDEDRTSELISQIKRLSPEQVKTLLERKRKLDRK